MITGDHKRTAFAIAKKIGITNNVNQVITGEELDNMTDNELRKKCRTFFGERFGGRYDDCRAFELERESHKNSP